MNMHGIVAPAVGAVNPLIPATMYESDGYTTAPDGTQVPAYLDGFDLLVQVQALTWSEIQQLDAQNIQGERRAVYLYGSQWNGVSRVDQRGGDLIVFPEVPGGGPKTWLVVLVLEKWPDWTKVAVTLQLNGVPGQFDFSDANQSGLVPSV